MALIMLNQEEEEITKKKVNWTVITNGGVHIFTVDKMSQFKENNVTTIKNIKF